MGQKEEEYRESLKRTLSILRAYKKTENPLIRKFTHHRIGTLSTSVCESYKKWKKMDWLSVYQTDVFDRQKSLKDLRSLPPELREFVLKRWKVRL